MSLTLTGIGVSRGIAIGKTYLWQCKLTQIPEYTIAKKDISQEVERLHQATLRAQAHMKSIRKRIPTSTSTEVASFIDTHLLMLKDSSLTSIPAHLIEQHHINAEWALQQHGETLTKVFEQMDDPYLRTRRDDVDHVVGLVQRMLLGTHEFTDISHHPDLCGHILLAEELTPADTILLQQQGILAFATESGGQMSHTAILARSLNIPAIVGVHQLCPLIRAGETLVLDGESGLLIANADSNTLAHYRNRHLQEAEHRNKLKRLRNQPSITLDGHAIQLHANIELLEDVSSVKEANAAGVGLYRTEFLFMNREAPPDEEEQFTTYKQVLEALEGAPLTIRTLDLGADKRIGNHSEASVNPENSALGLRAIRLCLKDPALFQPQLRAILRASAYGSMRLMIPMLSNLQELQQVKKLLQETKRALRRQGLHYDDKMPIGGMIEVPAAAISAHLFARQLDFMSIGTNDLVQFTLAIDRGNDELDYLFDPLHPAILSLINTVLVAGRATHTPVAMCGEMAGDAQHIRLLLGLGLREFSMHPSFLLESKEIVNQCDTRKLTELVAEVLQAETQSGIEALIERINQA